MKVTYKLVIAPTPDRLELLVNEFLKGLNERGSHFEFIGSPQVLHHETFAQAIEILE